jgi:hypothetical protein
MGPYISGSSVQGRPFEYPTHHYYNLDSQGVYHLYSFELSTLRSIGNLDLLPMPKDFAISRISRPRPHGSGKSSRSSTTQIETHGGS